MTDTSARSSGHPAPPLILASTSRYRRGLLDRLGIPYRAVAPEYEETMPEGVDPETLVLAHAEGKARSVAGAYPEARILGSDQVAVLDGRILGKPGTAKGARAQLRELSGREHVLLTAVVLLDVASGRVVRHVERSAIGMRDLTDDEIAEYVRRDDPVDCAGSYKAEGLGITLLAYQRGDDPTAVVGLPLIAVSRMLRGVAW